MVVIMEDIETVGTESWEYLSYLLKMNRGGDNGANDPVDTGSWWVLLVSLMEFQRG